MSEEWLEVGDIRLDGTRSYLVYYKPGKEFGKIWLHGIGAKGLESSNTQPRVSDPFVCNIQKPLSNFWYKFRK